MVQAKYSQVFSCMGACKGIMNGFVQLTNADRQRDHICYEVYLITRIVYN